MIKTKHRFAEFETIEEANEWADSLGAQGWRLHSFEPIVVVGAQGIGSVKYALAMVPTFSLEVEDKEDESGDDQGAMACRG